jgi:putative holliday junction resolvase
VHLACDVGRARIGLARCDPDGLIVTPLDALAAGTQAVAQVAQMASDMGAVGIVVGYPISLDGTIGPAADFVESWMSELGAVWDRPIVRQDERLSTVQAQRRLHEAGRDTRQSRAAIDSASATVILEAYIDRLKRMG